MKLKTRVLNKGCDCKQRILEEACRLFSEYGFRGTHIREVCRRAGVNTATVYYHYVDKERLFEAVTQEAYQQLLNPPASRLASSTSYMTPKQELHVIIESLFQRLNGSDAKWIAKLAIREVVEPSEATTRALGAGLCGYLALLQSAIRKMLSPDVDMDEVRLHALSVLSQCVFYCVAQDSLRQIFPELKMTVLSPNNVVNHIKNVALGSSK